MSFRKGVHPRVFRAIQNVDMNALNQCSEQEIRPVLPCLVRMGLISPLDTSKKCTNMKIDILTIVSGMELVNSIVALLSIDFHRLEIDVKKEQQLRSKNLNNNNNNNNSNNNSNNNNNNNTIIQDSILIGNLTNTSMALEYERSDMTRRSSILLGELLYIQSQIQDNNNPQDDNNCNNTNYMKSSELFDNDIFAEELSDIICIALAELPITLNILQIVETLLHLHNGPAIICRIVANFPDCFREVTTYLIQTGEKHEETKLSTVRTQTIQLLCKMNPTQSLTIRSKCIELCRMPALAITLTLQFNHNNDHNNDDDDDDDADNSNDIVAFISGLLLGNDQTIRNWIAMFIRTGQKKKGDISGIALQQLRDELLKYLQIIIKKSENYNSNNSNNKIDKLVVKGSAILRLYCALRGIAGIKFQEDEIIFIVKLLTIHPPPTQSGVRFVSISLCMLIACPSLITIQEYERKCIEWVQWLVKEEQYFEKTNQLNQSSFGEMLLLMAIHFHSNQLSAICDLVCSILGMKIPIRHNNMTRMKQVFIQEIFTEQIVTAHSVKVPVTKQLNATMLGFLPVHCIHQLLKSRAFTKYNVNIKNWIYKQICTSTKPLHPVLPLLIEVYVNNIILATTQQQQQQQQSPVYESNKPLDEQEIRYVFENSIFGQYFIKKQQTTIDQSLIHIDNTSLTPQLLLLYYLLLYEDCRLNNAHILTNQHRRIKIYNNEFMSELPIKYLLHHAQKDQSSYNGLFGPLLKLLTTHFPHLTLIDDWLDDMSTLSIVNNNNNVNNNGDGGGGKKVVQLLSDVQIVEIFNDIDKNPLKCAKLLQNFLKQEPIIIWKYCEIFIKFIKNFLNNHIPRYLQDLYKDVWLRFNTVLPRRLWVLTIKYLVDDFTNLTRIDVAEDPLQIMRCDERVFRCAPLYMIVLRILRASLASSRSQLLQHLQANPRLDGNGQILNENDREEMCRATIAAQESAAVQMLLETCLETETDRCIGGQQWALQEVRSLVCSYLHQVFIADTMLAKLVHFQGYPSELIEVIVKGVPSMHICLDFLQELMQQPSLNKQIFAIQLLSHLSIQYALPKSLNLCVSALNLLYALLGSLSSSQRVKLFKSILPSLVRISEAFPPLVDDIINLLMQLAKICESQSTLISHFDIQSPNHHHHHHLNKGLELLSSSIAAQESRELCDLVQQTFSDILDKAVLKTKIYKQQ